MVDLTSNFDCRNRLKGEDIPLTISVFKYSAVSSNMSGK